MLNRRLLVGVLVAMTGCGVEQATEATPASQPSPSTTMSPEQGAASVSAALEAAHQVRTALELARLLPTMKHGLPRAAFLLVARLELTQRLGCVATTVENVDDAGATLVVDFGQGCHLDGRALSGRVGMVLRANGDDTDVELDFRQLVVDGEALTGRVGYGTSADEQRVWAAAEGALPRRQDIAYRVDMTLAIADSGLPLFGSTTLTLDGVAELRRGAAVDAVGFEALEYEVGDYLPKAGAVRVQTADGHAVSARFSSVFWKLGQAQVSVDGGPEVAVPVVQ